MTKISSRGFNVSNNTSKDYNVKFNKKEKIVKYQYQKMKSINHRH